MTTEKELERVNAIAYRRAEPREQGENFGRSGAVVEEPLADYVREDGKSEDYGESQQDSLPERVCGEEALDGSAHRCKEAHLDNVEQVGGGLDLCSVGTISKKKRRWTRLLKIAQGSPLKTYLEPGTKPGT